MSTPLGPLSLTPLTLATRNPGKVRELSAPLAEYGFAVQVPPDNLPDVDETGATFEENALLKARAFATATGQPALADDSGLEVDDLDGAPGVYSARYGAHIPLLPGETKDQRNNRKLLADLAQKPKPLPCDGKARFHCCMALVWPNASQPDIVVNGVWEGRIIEQARGTHGFGYDPLFEDEMSGKSAAELCLEEKQRLSHRGKALACLLQKLQDRQSEMDAKSHKAC